MRWAWERDKIEASLADARRKALGKKCPPEREKYPDRRIFLPGFLDTRGPRILAVDHGGADFRAGITSLNHDFLPLFFERIRAKFHDTLRGLFRGLAGGIRPGKGGE